MPDLPTIEILGIPIACIDEDRALSEIERLYERGPALIAYANAHTLNLTVVDPPYKDVLRRAALVLNDGAGVALAARMQGRRFPTNLNGSDLNPKILRLAAAEGWRVFFLGGRPGVAAAAAEMLSISIPDLSICGVHHGYVGDDDAVATTIRDARADLVMVAMGNPVQERWLDEHLAATEARLGIGVGAFFDFTAGTQKRAPSWMNRMGVEWMFRLVREPRRMWRRYVLGNPLFLARVARARLARSR